MKAVFNVKDFRNMQKALEPVLYDQQDRPDLKYIRLEFTDGFVTACATNTFQASRFTIPCQTEGEPMTTWLQPVKIPASVKTVTVDAPNQNRVYIRFDDAEAPNELVQITPVRPMDFTPVFQLNIDRINEADREHRGFTICVDPRFLMNALAGFQKTQSVVLNFAAPDNAFTIRPYDAEGDVTANMALVYPIRM